MVTHVSQVLCARKFVADESATNQARKTHNQRKAREIKVTGVWTAKSAENNVTGLASQLEWPLRSPGKVATGVEGFHTVKYNHQSRYSSVNFLFFCF